MDLTKVEKQLKKVPEGIKKLFFSVDTARKIERIGRENGLHIDQIDTLIEETGYAMIGLKPPSEFVNNIKDELGIDNNLAKIMAEKINLEVLSEIKTTVRKEQEVSQNDYTKETPNDLAAINAPLEQAGGFSIEKSEGVNSEGNGSTNGNGFSDGNDDSHGVTPADRPRILNDIEYPAQSKERVVEKGPETPHKEPLVDHLLTTPTVHVESKVTVSAPDNLPVSEESLPPTAVGNTEPQIQPIVGQPVDSKELPPKPKGPDLYREPIQ